MTIRLVCYVFSSSETGAQGSLVFFPVQGIMTTKIKGNNSYFVMERSAAKTKVNDSNFVIERSALQTKGSMERTKSFLQANLSLRLYLVIKTVMQVDDPSCFLFVFLSMKQIQPVLV